MKWRWGQTTPPNRSAAAVLLRERDMGSDGEREKEAATFEVLLLKKQHSPSIRPVVQRNVFPDQQIVRSAGSQLLTRELFAAVAGPSQCICN